MFWKFAQKMLNKLLSIFTIFSRSISFRLAFTYMLTTFALLVVATFFLYWIFINRLQDDNRLFLQNKILILQKLLQEKMVSIRDEIIIEPPIDHYFSRVVDEKGKIVLETPGMNNLTPFSVFADIMPSGETTVKKHKRYYLLMNVPVDQSLSSHERPLFIQIAKDITVQHKVIEDSQESLMVILLVGIFLSVVIGIVVTRKNLRPLREITKATQRITVTQLKNRLDPSSWPSELSALAIAFNLMLDRIEEGFTRLSQFSSDLAHELRTPINNLIVQAEVTLSKLRTHEEYKEALESSLEEFQRLTYMIENLLFLARAENPQQTIVFSKVDIRELFKDICDFYEAASEEKGVRLNYQSNDYLKADVNLLRRALSNLVANALQHTFTGGMITLTSQIMPDQHLRICVADTGKGISKEHLPHLFDRFYRVDADRSQHTGGTGLGLSIVKSIVELHQGEVVIESAIDKGTVVTLILPSK